MSGRGLLAVAAIALVGCVGSTPPAPTRSTTTITSASLGGGEGVDRDVALARAERRLVVAAREIGVLQRGLTRQRPESVRAERELLRRAEDERAALERDVSRLSTTSPTAAEQDAIEARLDELERMLDQARK